MNGLEVDQRVVYNLSGELETIKEIFEKFDGSPWHRFIGWVKIKRDNYNHISTY